MSPAATLRSRIETALADRIPSALTPGVKTIREVMPTGIATIDAIFDGGLPVGAVTELIGAECSGRTALALSFIAQLTKADRVYAWIDVSNTLSPESAATYGIDLKRLLWVRCGIQPASQPASSSRGDFTYPRSISCRPQRKEGYTVAASARILALRQKPWSRIKQALCVSLVFHRHSGTTCPSISP
jgi:recombination protein RecA